MFLNKNKNERRVINATQTGGGGVAGEQASKIGAGGVAGEEPSMKCFCRRREDSFEEERVGGGRSQCSVDANERKGLFLGF